MKYQDMLGREIELGSYLLRTHSLGRSTAMSVSKVVKKGVKKNWEGKEVSPNIRVSSVRPHWREGEGGERTNPGTIHFLDRCVVIDRDFLPAEVADLLDQE